MNINESVITFKIIKLLNNNNYYNTDNISILYKKLFNKLNTTNKNNTATAPT